MNTKTYTTVQIKMMALDVGRAWDAHKNAIKVSGRALYNMVGIKKELDNLHAQIQQTLLSLFESHGGEMQPSGEFIIPDEAQAEVNQKLVDFGNETLTINYEEVKLAFDDTVPAEILEVFFDFIVFEN